MAIIQTQPMPPTSTGLPPTVGEFAVLPNQVAANTIPTQPVEQAVSQETTPGRIKRAALYVAGLVGRAIQAAPEIAAQAQELGALDWAQQRVEGLTGNARILADIGLAGARRAVALHRQQQP